MTGGSLQGMFGSSKPMKKLFKLLHTISSTDYPVLITGASGTGKEKAAQAIHKLSSRKDHPFIIINCGAIPENLLESELFGHEKGSFTGAIGRKTGKFELADKGTCFLDEVGELPLQLQVKLLRMLQENTVERVGGTQTIKLDVRILAATNVNLEQAVKDGTFREDFFHRLNVIPVHMPPLKDRGEDVFLLAHHFLREETEKLQKGQMMFSPATITSLAIHSWPGNVRELQNRIRRAISLSSDHLLHPEDLGLDEENSGELQYKILTLKEARDKAEKMAILNALALTDNNISKAAKLLETSRPTLHDLIKKHNVSF
jgi:two-component system NtrC family response regulator